MSKHEQEPSDLQSLEDIQVCHFDDLCELRNLVAILADAAVGPGGAEKSEDGVEIFRFDTEVCITYDQDELDSSCGFSGVFVQSTNTYDTFEIHAILKETLDRNLPDIQVESRLSVVVIEGVVFSSTISQGIYGSGFGPNGQLEECAINNYDLEALLHRLGIIAETLIVEDDDEDADVESDEE